MQACFETAAQFYILNILKISTAPFSSVFQRVRRQVCQEVLHILPIAASYITHFSLQEK
jgi:hypothetical protein